MTASNRAVRNLIDLIGSNADQLRNLYRHYGNIDTARFVCEYVTDTDLKITDYSDGRRTFLISKCQFTEELTGSKNLIWVDQDDLYQLHRAGREWVEVMLKAKDEHMEYLRSKEEKSKAQEAFEEAYL